MGFKMDKKMKESVKNIKNINCKEMHNLVKTKKPSTFTMLEGIQIAEHAMGCRGCRSLKLQDKV